MERRQFLSTVAAMPFIKAPPSVKISTVSPLIVLKSERVLGSRTAPLTVIEYASLTCPYCAKFHNQTLPKINYTWISTGKISLAFRHYPLDGLALRAAIIAESIPNELKFFSFISKLFVQQKSWTTAASPIDVLIDMAVASGMNRQRVKKALNDDELIRRILKGVVDARDHLNVRATPTFFVNNKKYPGMIEYEDFDNVLSKSSGR